MLAHSGKPRTDRDACHGFELHEIHDGDVAVCCRHVRAQMQVRAKERRPMLAQKHNKAGDGQRGKQKIGAEVLGTVHGCHEIVPWFYERSNAALMPEKCGNSCDDVGRRWRDFPLSAYGFVSGSALAEMAPRGSGDGCSPWRVR